MQLREMRVAAHLNLVELLVDMGDTEGVFQELTLSWALIAENSIAEMHASWFLLAARAWTLAQNPAIALMYLSLAERDRHMMTGAQISGCQQLVSQLHRQVAENNHACAKSSQLVEAQRLIDTGRVNEAAEKLLEIIGGSDLESRQHALEMIKELDDGLLEQQQE
ncbi:hypothetical protein EC988_009358 [Linderina pennispora]|nr:hypothetical protein EC988_009358 [Linderina pennispora]